MYSSGRRKKAIAMALYKSPCHRRALFLLKAGPVANGLLDVVETRQAGCHDGIREWAGSTAPATNSISLRGFSHLAVPRYRRSCLLEVALFFCCNSFKTKSITPSPSHHKWNALWGSRISQGPRSCVICRILRPGFAPCLSFQSTSWFNFLSVHSRLDLTRAG